MALFDFQRFYNRKISKAKKTENIEDCKISERVCKPSENQCFYFMNSKLHFFELSRIVKSLRDFFEFEI